MLLNLLMLFVVVVYFLAMLFIFTFSITQAILIVKYLKSKKNKKPAFQKDVNYCPLVTVQLPIYNELYVVERLIDKVCEINYPTQKLEIQVLDDSTDETFNIIKAKVTEWQCKGIKIVHLHRKNRTGYKAGALKTGLDLAKGEYIAIFDADFLPEKDFLTQTIPYFIDSKVGMVQTRWGHINRNYSLLTKLQAFGLDAHFTVEQVGRNYQNAFINFNGTAGIWRKTSIIDAGNWQPDTLTEDLDLSYRAQLKNWHFVYLEAVVSPAELPPVMSALKTQQYRWTKGGAETAKKHLWAFLNGNKSFWVKFHGVMHLLNGAVYLSILLCAFFSVPLLVIKPAFPQYKNFFLFAPLFGFSSFIIFTVYFISNMGNFKTKKIAFLNVLSLFPIFLAISMGLSLHNSLAVLEGYLGKKTPFVRTPKFNLAKKNQYLRANIYLKASINWVNILELLLGFYFVYGVIKGFILNDYGLIPFHILLAIGFFMVFFYSVKQIISSKI